VRWCGLTWQPPSGGGTLTRLSNLFNANYNILVHDQPKWIVAYSHDAAF